MPHPNGTGRSAFLQSKVSKRCRRGLRNVKPGDFFAENITTEGINLPELPLGTQMTIGETELQVSQIGKECHTRCAIYYQGRRLLMPKEGIFVKGA